MDTDQLIALFLETLTLKRMPRTGWLTRGVPHVESVADHSFGVAFVALALCDALQAAADPPQALDREKTLTMALLHDLAEVRLTDLPTSATNLIEADVKRRAEETAITDIGD